MNVLILGAGPVGLFTALVLSKKEENKITIFEKRKEYARDHQLRLNMRLLERLDSICSGPLLKLLKQYSDKVDKENMTISTKILERLLKEMVTGEKNVQLEYREFEPTGEFWKQHIHGKFHMVLGCDGRKSTFRSFLRFVSNKPDNDSSLQFIEPVRYLAQCQFEFKNKDYQPPLFSKIDSINFYKTQKYCGSWISESSKQNKVILRCEVDSNLYEKNKNFNLKDPMTLPQLMKAMPEQFFTKWMAARRYFVDHIQLIDSESVKVTFIPLHIYLSDHFHVTYDNVACFLLGDALMGFPYFMSLNANLYVLLEWMYRIQDSQNMETWYRTVYDIFDTHKEEIYSKDASLDSSRFLFNLNRWSPFQVVYYCSCQKANLESIDVFQQKYIFSTKCNCPKKLMNYLVENILHRQI